MCKRNASLLQETKNRALLKNFVGKIVDVAFAHAQSNVLAALDEGGNLHIYDLDMAHGDVDKFRLSGSLVVCFV